MQNLKFESRFSGASNKGLRAKIRRVANAAGSAPAAAHAVRGLASTVALTAQGRETLALVALDWDPLPATMNTDSLSGAQR